MTKFNKCLLVTTCLTASSLIAHNTDLKIQSGVSSDVAHCILAPDSSLTHITAVLETLSNHEANEALYELSPVNYGNIEWINARNNSYVADLLSQHLFQLCCSPLDCSYCNCCCCARDSSFWIHAFGNFMDNTKRFDNLSHFNATAGGVLVGIDGYYGPEFYLGVSFGYTHTNFHWKNKGHGDSDSFYGSVYGSWENEYLSIDYSLIGGGSHHHLLRRMDFAAIDRSARSNPWGTFVTAHLGLQSQWDWCCSLLEPYALVDYHYFHRNQFKEHGAENLDLVVSSKNQHILRGEAGLTIYWTWVCIYYCVGPYLGVSWVGEFPLNKSMQKAHFVHQSCEMDVTSYHTSVQLVSPQAGFKWTYTDGYSFILGYRGLYNSKTRINQVEGRLEWIY